MNRLFQFSNLLVILKNEDFILFVYVLHSPFHFIGLLVVGVDYFQKVSKCGDILLVDIIQLLEEFFFFALEVGSDDVELSGDEIFLSGVPLVGLFDVFEEGIFEFGHIGLGVSDFPHNILVLSFDLADGLLDQLYFMVFMRS